MDAYCLTCIGLGLEDVPPQFGPEDRASIQARARERVAAERAPTGAEGPISRQTLYSLTLTAEVEVENRHIAVGMRPAEARAILALLAAAEPQRARVEMAARIIQERADLAFRHGAAWVPGTDWLVEVIEQCLTTPTVAEGERDQQAKLDAIRECLAVRDELSPDEEQAFNEGVRVALQAATEAVKPDSAWRIAWDEAMDRAEAAEAEAESLRKGLDEARDALEYIANMPRNRIAARPHTVLAIAREAANEAAEFTPQTSERA